MLDLLYAVLLLTSWIVAYMCGIGSVVDLLRMYDNDLYCEWMRRRKERRRRK